MRRGGGDTASLDPNHIHLVSQILRNLVTRRLEKTYEDLHCLIYLTLHELLNFTSVLTDIRAKKANQGTTSRVTELVQQPMISNFIKSQP